MEPLETDGFDGLPDSLILQILNSVADVKTLIRLRSVSRLFNSLVPQAESLLLRVDCVISPESDSEPLLLSLLRSFIRSINSLFVVLSQSKPTGPTRNYSPAQILSQFERIRDLRIELPSGDLRLDSGVSVKWRAEFGSTLRSCVILGFHSGAAAEDGGGLKARVVWTISALIAASARHYLLREVAGAHPEMRRLVLYDKEGEGVVAMRAEGLKECRLDNDRDLAGGGGGGQTVVPSVRMRMRHEPRVRIDGAWVEGATLVVVRPCGEAEDIAEDAELVVAAFGGGAYGDAVRELLKSKSYLLEMNSF